MTNEISSILTSSNGANKGVPKSTLRDNPELATRAIERIFEQFADWYGARWTEAGASADAWARQLADFSVDAIAHAMKMTERNNTEWPPTSLTFRQYCAQHIPPMEERIDLSHRLTAPWSGDSPNAQKHKAVMRAMLGRGDESDKKAYRRWSKTQ